MKLPHQQRPVAMATLTYTLGQSLYVPLTSRCNSLTLPQTRGPNFLLPREVVSSLMNVRKIEESSLERATRLDDSSTFKGSQEERMRLPAPTSPMIERLDDFNEVGYSKELLLSDDERHPSSAVLFHEIRERSKQPCFKEIVIAGEGEPTLRLRALLSLARTLSQDTATSMTPLRVVSNGLVSTTWGNEVVASHLRDAGVDNLTVALMTSNPDDYNQLMKPKASNSEKMQPHHDMCEFVRVAVEAGLHVQVTGVEGGPINVDKEKAQELATRLGVGAPLRWRPYYP